MKIRPQSVCAACLLAAAMLFPARFAQAADGSWNVNAAGNWITAGSWLNNTIPGSNSTTTSTDIATFGLPTGNNNRVVTVDANRNIGGMTFSNTSTDASARYTLSSGNLLLSSGGVIQTVAANAGFVNISSAIAIQGTGGTGTFTANNTNYSGQLQGALQVGAVTGVSTTGNTTTLTLNGSSTAAPTSGSNVGNNISGVIGNGANGGKLAIVKDGSGTWVLSGANTFTGGLTINSGTLYSSTLNNNFGAGAFNMTGGTVVLRANQTGLAAISLSGTVNLLSDKSSPGVGSTSTLFGAVAAIASNTVVNVGVGPNVTSGTAQFNLAGMNTAGNATFNIQNTVVNGTTVTGQLGLSAASTFAAGTVTVTGNGNVDFVTSAVTGAGGLTLDSNFTGSVKTGVSLGHTGTTVINGGTLQLGAGGNQGSLNAATVITNNGTLVWNRIGASTQTITNGITGTGSVLLTGGGTSVQTNDVRLDGNNTYTGNTTISFGTLSFNNTGRLENSAIILSGSAVSVLNVSTMNGTTPIIKSLSGVAGSSVTLGSKTLLVGDASSTTFAGVISGAGGGLTKQGSGTMTLSGNNTYTGATTVSAGTLQFAKTASLYNGTTASWTAASIRAGNGTTLAFNVGGTGEFTTGNVTSLLTNLAASSSSTDGMNAGAILGFDTTNASGGNFAIADVIADTTGASGGARALAKLGTGTLALSGNNTYSGSTTINGGTLEIAATGRLGGGTYSGNITNNATFTYSGTNNQTLSGIVSGTGVLTQNGTGTLTLSGANTYSGGTAINAGTLTLSGTSGSLGSANVTVAGNATLQLAHTSSTSLANNISGAGNILHSAGTGITTTLAGTNTNAGGIQSTGGGTLLFSGAGALSSAITSLNATNSSTLSFADSDTRTITLGSSGISLSTAKLSFDVDLSSSTSDSLIFGQAASLTGTNTVNLNLLSSISANQTWTLLTATSGLNGTWSLGTYTQQVGYTFSLSSDATWLKLTATVSSNDAYWTGEAGSSWLNTNFSTSLNGTASLAGASLTGRDVFFAATNNGNLTTTPGANYSINTLQVITPGVTINGSNTLNVTSSSPSAIRITATGNTTINANLAGVAGLTKSGTGTLALGGNNSYTGATSITGGTVIAASNTAFGDPSGAVTLNPGAGNTTTLQSGVASLTISNNFLLSSGTTAWNTDSYDTALSGTLSGVGALTKNGLGTLTLAGSNTYTGATTVNAGTLTLTGGLNGSSVTINGGVLNQTATGTIAGTGTTFTLTSGNATLAGSNSYTGATTVNAGTLTLSGGLNGSSVTINGGVLNQTATGTIAGTGTTFTLASGNATLAGNNTFSGAISVGAGTLEIASTGRLSGGTYSPSIANNGTFIYSGTNNQTLSGIISGTGALTQNNSSTLTLSGINTYTGTTTINAGTLEIASTGRLGGGTYSQDIANNGTLIYSGTNNQTLSGIISGTGALTQNNSSSTLTLTGNNTYTGVTTINAGILNIQHNNALGTAANGTVVSSGATLRLQNNITVAGEALTISGGGVVYTGALNSLSGNNEWTGNITNVSHGTRIVSSAGLLTISGNINTAGFNTYLYGTGGNITVSGVITGNDQYAQFYAHSTSNSVLTLSNNNTFTAQMNIQNGIVSVSSIKNFGVASGLGAAASSAIQIGATSTNGTLLYTGAGDTSNRTIQIGSNTGTPLAADTGSATIENNGSGALVFNAAIFNAQTNATTGVGADRTLTLSGSNTGNNTISGVIQNNMVSGTGTGTARIGLIKNGVGTWILSGNNTYTGATTINAGTLQIGAGGASGALSTSSTITNNGTLVFNRSGTLTQGTDFASGISGTGNLTQAGPGNLIITAANSYTGATTVANGTLTLSGSGTLGTSTITITGGTLDLGVSSITNTFSSITGGTLVNGTLTNNGGNYALQNGTVSTNLAGTNGLTKSGAGTLTLTGSNTYSGATTLSAGNLSISSASALTNTSSVNLANATALIYTGGSAATLDRAISVTGATGSTGTLRNTGGALTLTGGLTKNGTTLTFDSGTFNVNTVGISGSAANSDLVIDGATVNLNIANTYNGPTRIIDGGTLNANATGALPTATRSAISIDATGTGSSTLALGANQSVASLTGAASSNVTLGSNTLTIGSASGNTTYAGRITGGSSSALVKDGASTQVLTGDNTGFTGTTTVSSGTLQAAAAGALGGTTNIDVNGGSLLVAVANAVNSNANINLGGGTLAVSGNFNQNVGALTLSADSIIDLNGFSGILRFSGLSWASGASNAKLAIWNWSGTPQHGPPVNDYTNPSHVVFTSNANLTSENLAKISFYSGNGIGFVGNAFSDSFSDPGFSGTEIIAVPEPETYLTGVILLLVGVIYLRRQAKHREGHRPAWPKFLLGSRETTPSHHPAPQAPDPHPAHKGARSSRA